MFTRSTWPVILCLLAATLHGTRSAARDSAAGIEGNWKGVYYQYPNVMVVEIALRSDTEGTLAGELKFSPAPARQYNAVPAGQGSYQVSGRFDATNRSFTLTPGAWIQQPGMPGPRMPIVGVLDSRSNELAALLDSPSPDLVFFILAGAGRGDRLVADILRSADPPPPSNEQAMSAHQADTARRMVEVFEKMPPSPSRDMMLERYRAEVRALPPDSAGPSLDRLREWAGRMDKELPGVDAWHTPLDKLGITARNLYEDSYFKEYFGKTFDQLDAAQRKTILNVFVKNQHAFGAYSIIVGRPFTTVGQFSQAELTVSIFWQRAMRGWLAASESNLAALPPEPDVFASLAAAEATSNKLVFQLWPTEKKSYDAKLAAARSRLAGPVLGLHADQLIASAAGIVGARALTTWRTTEKEVLKYAPDSVSQPVQQRIDARLDELLGQLMTEESRKIAGFGRGIAAVTEGVSWYEIFAKNYDFCLDRVPVRRLLQDFQAARAKALEEATPAILASLNAADTVEVVRLLLRGYLGCPGDESTAAAATIRRRANERITAVEHEQMLALFSDGEKRLMDPPNSGHLDPRKADDLPPTEEEVRLALLRSLAFGTGKVLDPHRAKVTKHGAMLLPATFIVTIADVTFPRRKNEAIAVKDGNHWLVRFHWKIRFAVPDKDPLWDLDRNLREGAEAAVKMMNATTNLMGEEESIRDFRLYSDGWGVPSLREEGAVEAGVDAWLQAISKRQ